MMQKTSEMNEKISGAFEIVQNRITYYMKVEHGENTHEEQKNFRYERENE